MTPDPNTPLLHAPDTDLATSTHPRLPHARLPNRLDLMNGNLHLAMNTVDIMLTVILLAAIAHEVVLPPETAHCTLNLLLEAERR